MMMMVMREFSDSLLLFWCLVVIFAVVVAGVE